MKHFNKLSYVAFLVIAISMVGCNNTNKKSNSSDDHGDNQIDIEYRISTYEFHISGGPLDGQTFSGAFPNDGQHGQGQLLSKVASNIPKDVVHIRINDEKEQGNYIIVDANLVLDDTGKLLPIASNASYRKESTIHFQIADNLEDMVNRVQLTSKSGTVSISNLKLEQDATKSLASMIDCDVKFEAEFYSTKFGTGETPQAVPATVKGEFHIKSNSKNEY